ncbi:uncharacterized protein LOC110117322 isoform X2 [Athalia rosae]|uniref:uncharacterized protein LOC110117322 isoform X2 n=1 Tax=Athalia rosae TaxID=37344 RepID=UPI00203466A0|nr:uncharacterized protein LOC110117322 isoform X2 [Athalia rosae]
MDQKKKLIKVTEMSLSEVTKPIILVSRLLGMNPKSSWYKIHTVFVMAINLSVLCAVWGYFMKQNLLIMMWVTVFLRAFQDFCRLILAFFVLAPCLWDSNRFMIPLKEFRILDAVLRSLGVSIDNKITYRAEMRHLIYFWLLPMLVWISDLSLYLPPVGTSRFILFLGGRFFAALSISICAAADSCFATTLFIIKERFRVMNSILRRNENNSGRNLRIEVIRVTSENSDVIALKELKTLRKQYHFLWKIIKQVNMSYGPHLLVAATVSLAMITVKLWECYFALTISTRHGTNLTVLHDIAGKTVWAIFYFLRLFWLAKTCESMIAEAKITIGVVQVSGIKADHRSPTKSEVRIFQFIVKHSSFLPFQITVRFGIGILDLLLYDKFSSFATVCSQIRDFLVQLKMEVQNFSACRFFDFNFRLICGMVSAVCTYLVILIQMGGSNARRLAAIEANNSAV